MRISKTTREARFYEGLLYQLQHPDEDPRGSLLPVRWRSRDKTDHTVQGRKAAVKLLVWGYPRPLRETLELQRIEQKFDARLSGKMRSPPCINCEFIALCKHKDLTCATFRGYVGHYTPDYNTQCPDKHWDESWPEEE